MSVHKGLLSQLVSNGHFNLFPCAGLSLEMWINTST